jgi:uncharacterized protein (DUF2225 family)
MRRVALALALGAALGSPLHATKTEEVGVTCPVCGNEFRAERWFSTNNFGGHDRDFLEHAAGGQVFIICCWTCPRCCYTGSPVGFRAWINDEIAKAKGG